MIKILALSLLIRGGLERNFYSSNTSSAAGKAVLITHSSGMTQALRRADCRDRRTSPPNAASLEALI